MRRRDLKKYSYLLILLMSFSALQGAFASTFDQFEAAVACEMGVTSIANDENLAAMKRCNLNQLNDNCLNHECPSPCNFTSLHALSSFKLLTSTSTKLKHDLIRDYAIFPSHHPDLLKRPPKA